MLKSKLQKLKANNYKNAIEFVSLFYKIMAKYDKSYIILNYKNSL